MKKKLWVIALVCVCAVLALACVLYWRGAGKNPGAAQPSAAPVLARKPVASLHQPYVGKWTFAEGTAKTDLVIRSANGESKETSLVGKSVIVKERNGALWLGIEGEDCWQMLRMGQGGAELVPGRIECDKTGPDGAVRGRAKAVRVSLSIDAEGRAHISAELQISLEAKGLTHEGHLFLDGIATREAGSGD